MQRLGLVLHVNSNCSIIVKVEKTPKIGETVVDDNLKPVGKVSDLLGPVCSPYVAIRPTIRDAQRLVNKTVYVLPSKRRKEREKYG